MRRFGQDVVDLARERAQLAAAARDASVTGTVHVLFALLSTYGPCWTAPSTCAAPPAPS